jgi:hypothetical protein
MAPRKKARKGLGLEVASSRTGEISGESVAYFFGGFGFCFGAEPGLRAGAGGFFAGG